MDHNLTLKGNSKEEFHIYRVMDVLGFGLFLHNDKALLWNYYKIAKGTMKIFSTEIYI